MVISRCFLRKYSSAHIVSNCQEMGGHHGPELPKVPDWRIYRVEDVPQLMQVQKALAQHGLSDPWLRNEVWRYTEFINKESLGQIIRKIVSKGFKLGLAAAVVTTAIELTLFPIRKPYGDKAHDEHH